MSLNNSWACIKFCKLKNIYNQDEISIKLVGLLSTLKYKIQLYLKKLEIVIIFNDNFLEKIYNSDNTIKYKIFSFNYKKLE